MCRQNHTKKDPERITNYTLLPSKNYDVGELLSQSNIFFSVQGPKTADRILAPRWWQARIRPKEITAWELRAFNNSIGEAGSTFRGVCVFVKHCGEYPNTGLRGEI